MYNTMYPSPYYQAEYCYGQTPPPPPPPDCYYQPQPPFQAYVYPPMMQLPIVTTGPWSTGLCDCYEDCHSCCLTFFCPCVTFGRIAEALDDGSVPCSVSGTLYALLLTVSVVGCWWVCLYSCFYRTKLRQQYLLEEEPCNDFVVHLIFQQCALCQEYREIQNRGYIMSLGWHGNVERQRRMAISTMNPININMMQPACLESGMIR